jgi:hypothetical protein
MSRVGGEHGDTIAVLIRGFLWERSGARLIVQWTDLRNRLAFRKTLHD